MKDCTRSLTMKCQSFAVDPEIVMQYEGDQDHYIWTREEVIKDIKNRDITLVLISMGSV